MADVIPHENKLKVVFNATKLSQRWRNSSCIKISCKSQSGGGGFDPLQRNIEANIPSNMVGREVADDFNRDENNLQATVHWI
jgi:hypothetical protein